MSHSPLDVRLRQVSHTFNGRDRGVPALANISLTIDSGEFVALVGPSGCGKSTLLRLVAGLLTPSRGYITLGGQPPAQARRHKAIGWMAQQAALLPWRTVLENVRLPLQVNRQVNRPPASPEQLLALVDLADFADAYPHTLSGGMQQRVALARLLATGASLWLMDEPFAALDELTRGNLADELLVIWQKFRPTVLWVTHHLQEAVYLADRLVILSARPGQVAGELTIDLPRPRDDTSADFQALVRRARQILGRGQNG
ncbi:MAG: ABC transporter ATP-binding protein [Chloroflexi bacterium]|nr:MAG: ABC transporter ATP-binding protein [Chloroflexota bacterium]